MPGVRPLADQDLPQAQKIVRTAFGTFFGAPDLDNFWTDFDYVYGRHGAEHVASFAADDEKGHLAGVNFATRWGSVGFFGPLSVRPDLWDKGVATPLVAAVSNQFERWVTEANSRARTRTMDNAAIAKTNGNNRLPTRRRRMSSL
jgi:hypothetical protein